MVLIFQNQKMTSNLKWCKNSEVVTLTNAYLLASLSSSYNYIRETNLFFLGNNQTLLATITFVSYKVDRRLPGGQTHAKPKFEGAY